MVRLTAANTSRIGTARAGAVQARRWGSRPALVIDDPHPARDGYSELPLSQLYERADPAQVLLRLELEKPLDRDVAADLASSFYDRLVTGTVASLGESATVTYGSEESEESWGLVVGGMTSRKNGHIGLTKATEAAWSRVVSKLRSGELTSAEFWITRTDAFGRGNWQSFSHLSASFSIWREAYEDKESPPRVLAISVDLPYFHEMFRPADAAAFARSALASLPVRRGFVHVGRWAHSTDHWIDILPASEVSHPSDYAITENHGQLLWLQRTADAPTPIVEI